MVLTADVVSAYVANNPVPTTQLAELIASVHGSLMGLTSGQVTAPAEALEPAVPVKKSIYEDYIVCLEDAKMACCRFFGHQVKLA